MNLNDDTIFIAGAASGIGLGLALRFQAAGNRVIVGGRRTELLEQIAAEHPGVETVVIDTTDPATPRSRAHTPISAPPLQSPRWVHRHPRGYGHPPSVATVTPGAGSRT